MEERDLYICGDIHGELKLLVHTLVIQRKIKDADILIVGDFGVGFGGPNSMNVLYDKVKTKLEKNNLMIYTIRGNHDDPEWFDGEHDYPRLHFLPDHTILNLCGFSIYPIGGATSEDIDKPGCYGRLRSRRQENERLIRFGSRRRIWWENEGPTIKEKGLPARVDLIVSHEAPLSFPPISMREENVSYETWEKVLETRRYLDYILYEVRCSWWFYGHHHQSVSGHYGEIKYRCLGINEIYKVGRKE